MQVTATAGAAMPYINCLCNNGLLECLAAQRQRMQSPATPLARD
jgi:hypothetical protein